VTLGKISDIDTELYHASETISIGGQKMHMNNIDVYRIVNSQSLLQSVSHCHRKSVSQPIIHSVYQPARWSIRQTTIQVSVSVIEAKRQQCVQQRLFVITNVG
jgi:hypothetical protein